jgi:hypothetical protein
VQPSPEFALVPEALKALPGGQKRILGDVLSVVMITQYAERHPVCPWGVTAGQLVESVQVTLLDAANQVPVRRSFIAGG